ncbi:uncharacterized protein isoform X1 [Rhodnius prolixus]|uniref:uncharacterized protein isoform X1 n=1 Tax=Rhodnius prolixus TaxID=13249 RepID=UPI003D187868
MLNSPPTCLPYFDSKNNKQTACEIQFHNSTEQQKCSNVTTCTTGSQGQNIFALQELVNYSSENVLQTSSPTTSLHSVAMSYQEQRQLQSSMAAVSLEPSKQHLSAPIQTTTIQKSISFPQRSQTGTFSWEHSTQNQIVPMGSSVTKESVQCQQQSKTVESNIQETMQSSSQAEQQQITQSEVQMISTSDNLNKGCHNVMEGTVKFQNFPVPKKRFNRRQMLRRRRDPFKAKIFKRTEKKRRNAYLKQLLAPKSALSILQELCPQLKISVSEVQSGNQSQYATKVEVPKWFPHYGHSDQHSQINNKIYNGTGKTEDCAKEMGSENALKAILLEKLEQMDMNFETEYLKSGIESNVEMVSVNNAEDTMDTDDKDEGECIIDTTNQKETENKELEEDNANWSALTRFAIYKLFSEWKAQGLNEPATSDMIIRTKMGNLMKSIPGAIPRKHPVQLLLEIKPNCQFIEKREGSPPNIMFTYSVSADGKTFTGSGRNIKLAKKECAKNALAALGVKYVCL